jgi:hypothetical protein
MLHDVATVPAQPGALQIICSTVLHLVDVEGRMSSTVDVLAWLQSVTAPSANLPLECSGSQRDDTRADEDRQLKVQQGSRPDCELARPHCQLGKVEECF